MFNDLLNNHNNKFDFILDYVLLRKCNFSVCEITKQYNDVGYNNLYAIDNLHDFCKERLFCGNLEDTDDINDEKLHDKITILKYMNEFY